MRHVGFRRRAIMLAGAAAAVAGTAAAQPAMPERATNIPGVTMAATPPEEFDALNAGEAALAAYGFPPRPDASANPAGFAHWAAVVGSHAQRLVPRLQQTVIASGPHRPASPSVIAGAATSNNWSGYAALTSASSFGKGSISKVSGDFVVPAVSARSCDGTWDYSFAWVGIDGYTSNDVLQAGIEADAQCIAGVTQAYYSPWYEWYPNTATRITNLSVTPGQSFLVDVWATSATAGHALLLNVNTKQSVSINFSAPTGTRLIGNSAEWIVEAPTVSGALTTLSFYGLDFFARSTGTTVSQVVHTPGSASSVAISLVRSGTPYSTVGLLGAGGILFTAH